jgi:hypothetical protein
VSGISKEDPENTGSSFEMQTASAPQDEGEDEKADV